MQRAPNFQNTDTRARANTGSPCLNRVSDNVSPIGISLFGYSTTRMAASRKTRPPSVASFNFPLFSTRGLHGDSYLVIISRLEYTFSDLKPLCTTTHARSSSGIHFFFAIKNVIRADNAGFPNRSNIRSYGNRYISNRYFFFYREIVTH